MIKITSEIIIPAETQDIRHAEIIIGDSKEAYRWRVGGLPVDGDLLPVLESRYDELFTAAKNGSEKSEAFTPAVIVTEILSGLETAFWQFAKQFTGEPEITQLKLKNWQDKYYLAMHWELNGKPDVFKDPETYAIVILEASKRFNLTDPNQLIESWLRNSTAWENLLNWYYLQYEPGQRGLVYKAQAEVDIDYLIGFSSKIEANLYAAVEKYLTG